MLILWAALITAILLPFLPFLRAAAHQWLTDPTFSYGALVPLISVWLVWERRQRLRAACLAPTLWGVVVLAAGCALLIMGTVSGILLVSGLGFTCVLVGAAGFIWGKNHMIMTAFPAAYLLLMVPLPSYFVESLTWHLQELASTASSRLLQSLGVTVFQDGNLLILPNFALEVKEACSGSRSVFALVALAVLIGLTGERRWLNRIILVAIAPLVSLASNIVRIVGTGLMAQQFGAAAADESLHALWGVIVFLLAVGGMLAVKRFILCPRYRSA